MAEGPLPGDLSKVDPESAWRAWQPALGGWNRKWAAHLFRRAAFGAPEARLQQALKDGPAKTIDALMVGEPDAAERLELLTETGRYYSDPASLRTWWLYAMLESGHPLREKLSLFWHNHFATSYAKVRSTKLMFEQNVTVRKHALGAFAPFLLEMSKDTAMLVWLDSNRNVKGVPNENFAREVMELFSLGVGNYTEKDIQEAARALTGWHHDAEVSTFEFNRELHDGGTKTVFGKSGKFTGEDVARLCCEHPACAPFLVGKLYAFLVSETPPPKALLQPLAEQYRKSGYDTAALVRTVLSSRLFFSEHAYRKRVKWPVECALGAIQSASPERVPLGDVVEPLSKMGQALFAPPNVKGWRTGTDWLNSATLLARNNFTEKVALGDWSRGPRARPNGRTFAFVGETAKPTNPAPQGDTPSAPPPDAKFDVCALVYATKPKTVTDVVKRIGELLYGDAIPLPVAQKVETFLLTPQPEGPRVPPQPKGPPGAPGDGFERVGVDFEGQPPKKAAKVDDAPPPKPKQPEPKRVPPKPLNPKDVKVEDAAFKARVREAVHAMMCLPEYQLG